MINKRKVRLEQEADDDVNGTQGACRGRLRKSNVMIALIMSNGLNLQRQKQ